MESQFRGKKSEEERWREDGLSLSKRRKKEGLSKNFFEDGRCVPRGSEGSSLGVWVESWAGHESRRVQVIHSEAGQAAAPATQGNTEAREHIGEAK